MPPHFWQITLEQNLNCLSSRATGTSAGQRRVPEKDGDGEGPTMHHAKFVVPHAPSGKEIAPLEDGRLIELKRQLSRNPCCKN